MKLAVGNLPANRLALTNKVYVSTRVHQALVAQAPPEDASNVLIRINHHPFAVDGNKDVPDDQLALNGLQRRFLQLSLGTVVSVKHFAPPPNFSLVQLELSVDFLSKKQNTNPRAKPREIDTERLASDVLTNYGGHPFEVGRVLAMDFQGTKVELVCQAVGCMDLEVSHKYTNMGQLLQQTEIVFSRAEGSQGLALVGSNVAGGGGGANNIFLSDFDFAKLGIGGLDEEFNQIFRRAFASRLWPSRVIAQMGINHVRGMLLFGPPGCGKTLIARKIGQVLNAREPKIVNGPEILNKFVGGSEEKIRELFAEAEKEQKEAGDSSMLHIIILDEMDAICKQRGSSRDGTGVSDSVVNQLLSKIDGVDSLNNILLIGMTNRKDMIDDALLRPGRLEVHVEIGLPSHDGRLQILNIHTKNMREANRVEPKVVENFPELAEKTKNFSGAELEGLVKAASSYALTRCVDMNDLSKAPDEKKLVLTYADFERALGDVEPKFGAKSTELKACYRNGMVVYDRDFQHLQTTMMRLVEQGKSLRIARQPTWADTETDADTCCFVLCSCICLSRGYKTFSNTTPTSPLNPISFVWCIPPMSLVRTSEKTPLMSVLLSGESGSGKTAIAAKVAVDSGFPFVRMVSADDMIGYSEMSKCQAIHRAFLDSYKSPLSLIFIDDIERIIDYVKIGPRFSNTVLQTLLVLLKKIPPDEGRRLLVIGTTSNPELLADLGLPQVFGVSQHVPLLEHKRQISQVLKEAANMTDREASEIADAINDPIGIKKLLLVVEMARQGGTDDRVDVVDFIDCLNSVGI